MIMPLFPVITIVLCSVFTMLLCWHGARKRGLHQTRAARLGLAMGLAGLVLGTACSILGMVVGGGL